MVSLLESTSTSRYGEDFFKSDEGDEPYAKRHMYTSEILGMWNLAKIIRELDTREKCVTFAEEKGLVLKEKMCNVHKKLMKVTYSCNNTVGAFLCGKRSCQGKSRITRSKGTWFEDVRMELTHIFYLMYCFAHQWPYDKVILEDILRSETLKCLSPSTISSWYNYCREAVVTYQLARETYVGKIGGPGKIVQIDESKFKRKYNKGSQVEGQWVLGLIEDGCEDLRLEVCPDNIISAEVMVPLIKKHVVEGTTLHTDYWHAYDCLSEHGYIHKKVNLRDPDDPFVPDDGTHTERPEFQWRVVKNFFLKSSYSYSDNFSNVIVEYMWRRSILRHKKDPFEELLKVAKYVYKP